MVIALIISITVAVIFISLFIDERSSTAGYRNEIKEQKKTIEHLYAERGADGGNGVVISRPRSSVDDQEQRELTPELVEDALKYNGYVPAAEDMFVVFMIQGERYFVRTDRLPYFMIEKPYSLDKDKYDIVLLREAASRITDSIFIGKIFLSEDGENLRFQADAYEPTYGHLRDSIGCYLGVIHEMQKQLHDVYEDMLKRKENQKEFESLGFRTGQEVTGDSKILS